MWEPPRSSRLPRFRLRRGDPDVSGLWPDGQILRPAPCVVVVRVALSGRRPVGLRRALARITTGLHINNDRPDVPKHKQN